MRSSGIKGRPPAKGLPKLPPNWEWGAVADGAANEKNAIVDGPFGSNLKLSDYIAPPGVPVLTTRNLREGFGPDTLRYISPEKSQELSRSIVRGGDIIMAKIGSCGVSCIYPHHMVPAMIPANLLKMTVHPSITPKFAYYYFLSECFQEFLKEIITATAQPAFNVSKFRCLPFAFAPAMEQPRVVAEIEKQFTRLEAAVAALKRVRANLKRYRASVLKAACEGRLVPIEAELARAENRPYEPADRLLARVLKERRAKWEADQLAKMQAAGKPPKDDKWKARYKEPEPPDTSNLPSLPEGWAWASADTVSSQITDGEHIQPPYTESGFPLLTAKNVRGGFVDFQGAGFIDRESFQTALARCAPREGDVLIVSVGATTGRAAIVGKCQPFAIVRSVLLLRPLISAQVLLAWAQSPQCQEWIKVASGSTAQAHFYIKDTKRMPVPVPPLAEQRRIVAEVERRLSVIDELGAAVEANLKRAGRLRQAILKRAFEGKLVPQDPNDEPASLLLERIRADREARQAGKAAASTRGRRPRKAVDEQTAELFR